MAGLGLGVRNESYGGLDRTGIDGLVLAPFAVTSHRGDLLAGLSLVAWAVMACLPGPPASPSGSSGSTAPAAWRSVALSVPEGPSGASVAGFGVTGPLIGGMSGHGPWLNHLDGSASRAVAADVLGRMPLATTVAGVVVFRSNAIALLGSSADGETPLELLASPNDVDWTVVTPANIDRGIWPQGLVATGDSLALVGSTLLDSDPPTSHITVYLTRDGRSWIERRDPALDLEGRSIVQVTESGGDLIIVASASPMAFSVGPPILLIGHDGGATWESHLLADLAGATIASGLATPGNIRLVGCDGADPPTAVVWTYLIADPRSAEVMRLSAADSCASAIAPVGDGYVVVGAVGGTASGWYWQPRTGELAAVSFPEAGSDVAVLALSSGDDYAIAAGSTLATPGAGGEQYAAGWVAANLDPNGRTP